MQTIFLAQNANGACRELRGEPAPEFAGGFWLGERLNISDYPPPGECREYRLVPVGEEYANDAQVAKLETKLKNADTYGKAMADDNRGLRERIRELEQQLAERDNQLTLARGDVEVYRKQLDEQRDLGSKSYAVAEGLRSQVEQLEKQLDSRSPGVMPECVGKMLNLFIAEGQALKDAVAAVDAYYSPPDGHEWQCVDAEHPITAADVERKVFHRNGGVDFISEYLDANIYSVVVGVIHYTPSGNARRDYHASGDITHILRPVAPPFVFDGSMGMYRVKMDSGPSLEVEVILTNKGLRLDWIDRKRTAVNADGTFAGGKITGRVE